METIHVALILLLVWLLLYTQREVFGPFIRQTGLDGAVALDNMTVMDAKIVKHPFIQNPMFWRQWGGDKDACIMQCARTYQNYPPDDATKSFIDPERIPYCLEKCENI